MQSCRRRLGTAPVCTSCTVVRVQGNQCNKNTCTYIFTGVSPSAHASLLCIQRVEGVECCKCFFFFWFLHICEPAHQTASGPALPHLVCTRWIYHIVAICPFFFFFFCKTRRNCGSNFPAIALVQVILQKDSAVLRNLKKRTMVGWGWSPKDETQTVKWTQP